MDDSPLPFRSRKAGAERFAAFVSRYLIVPKGNGSGKPMRLRPWQVEMLRPFLDPDPRPVVGAIMGPRGLGKTALFAALGLYELFTGPDGNEIPIVAVDERMAGRLLKPAAQMVEANPELASRSVVYRDRIEVPGKRSTLTALPAEAKRIEGLGTWTIALADELGEIDRDTWSTLLLGAGKLGGGAMALGIGTPPNRETSVLTDLRLACRANPDDPTMAFVEFSADGFEHHPVECPHCLELANPQLDDLLSRDRATALLKQTTEGEYRRKRLCQVVITNESPFLTPDAWDALATGDGVPDGAEVVLAVDASLKDDSTAIVVGTVDRLPHFDKLDVWESPGYDSWRVPVLDVEQAIRDAARRWKVREVAFDPYLFTRSAQILAAEGLPMVEFRQSPARQTAATMDLRSAAVNAQLTHSGDDDLRRHVLAATVLESDKGIRIAKANRSRHAAKIDLATALMMCHSRATWLASQAKPPKRYASFRA
ncbi:terminase TerL endonuclease subunit [Mycobacterium shigaense]|uniref:terminase TerL endonuclease subunit n=1 Tax=Mycobacterium shigaense TaxID=722731 RepID=UPI002AE0354F|nr:terminase TerL endonuclease subunit [Mycobacterium shigaense]MEA1121713.1 terminase TerL endonuclease subunit [Mycobacterium shigaense]